MTTGLGSGTVAAILNQLCNAGTWTDPPGFFVQLHTADPGVAGVGGRIFATQRGQRGNDRQQAERGGE